jgi:DNA polymerase (family 10)
MNSSGIIQALDITGKLMELHEGNPFKVKAYSNAAYKLSKLRYDFEGKSVSDIQSIEGIGKSIAEKINELIATGTTTELSELLDRTPRGVIEMLSVKGLGPKKVRQLWQELNIESVGELLYACNENRLVTLKGFGPKTQAQVLQSIEFKNSNANKFLYAAVEKPVLDLVNALSAVKGIQVAVTGEVARKNEIIEKIEILMDGDLPANVDSFHQAIPLPVDYLRCTPSEFQYRLVETSSASAHLVQSGFMSLSRKDFKSGAEVYEALGMQYVEPELREGLGEVDLAREKKLPRLIETGDLRGILHNHSTYSDGMHTLKEMADYCRELGYSYFGICDHSRSAFYAQGLSIEKVLEQQQEIERLNAGYKDFKILKGIESDILSDGSLDYPEEILVTFDFIVASILSNLKLDDKKATARVISAVENPYTDILGHPSGRLLLARKVYPLDYRKVIDACAANGVAIELNANPYRLDIDWRWIPYCLEKGVMISINPDAHHKQGLHDMYYGVCAARKGMLPASACLNALPLAGLLDRFRRK